jgi:hypothetical protein
MSKVPRNTDPRLDTFEIALDELATAHEEVRKHGFTNENQYRRCQALESAWHEYTKIEPRL